MSTGETDQENAEWFAAFLENEGGLSGALEHGLRANEIQDPELREWVRSVLLIWEEFKEREAGIHARLYEMGVDF